MTDGDFYGSEQSAIMESAGSVKIVFKGGRVLHFSFSLCIYLSISLLLALHISIYISFSLSEQSAIMKGSGFTFIFPALHGERWLCQDCIQRKSGFTFLFLYLSLHRSIHISFLYLSLNSPPSWRVRVLHLSLSLCMESAGFLQDCIQRRSAIMKRSEKRSIYISIYLYLFLSLWTVRHHGEAGSVKIVFKGGRV